MEFGPHQIQIAVCLVVVLGAAFVALIVDHLKTNNDQLRELALELKMRRQEDQRAGQKPAQVPPATTVSAKVPVRPAEPAAAFEQIHQDPSQQDQSRQDQSRHEKKRPQAPARSLAAPKERKRMPSPEAMAAMARGAQLAASPLGQSPAAQRLAKAALETPAPEVKSESAPMGLVDVKSTPAPKKKDWGSLLSRGRKTDAAPAVREVPQEVTVETASEPVIASEFPAGFHPGFQDGYILSHLVQSRRPVSGLVVSIGVNTPQNSNGVMPEPVCELIQSLIGPRDFACQSSQEEFLLIYPEERGASAQRKLSEIAQQLWDFQLRSLGTFAILFSWGGVEVRSESIEEAISAANERMQETRRGRKLITMESRNEMPLREAV